MQLKVAGERINQVSLVNVTTIALFIFSMLGTLPLFYFLDDYRYETGVKDQSLVLIVLLCSSINIISFLFGVIFVRKLLILKPIRFRSREIRSLSRFQKLILIAIFAFCVWVLLYYLRQLDQIAIITALTDGVDAAKQARSDMGSSFSGKYHWYKLVMRDIGSMLAFSSFALWLNHKNILSFFAFILTFIYSTFVAVMATEKAPFAWFLIGLFMTYFLVKNNGFIPFRKLAPFTTAITIILVFSYIFFMGSDSIGSALWSIFSRAFSGSISPAYFYLEFFPNHQDYLLGRTFPNPGGLMPYEPYGYTVEVMNWKFPPIVGSGVVSSAPTVFWGEAYANFGPAGIPVIAFIMGSLSAITSYLVSKMEINALSIGLMVWLILIFKDLSISGFSGYFYNIYIISLIFIVIFVFFIRGYFRVRN